MKSKMMFILMVLTLMITTSVFAEMKHERMDKSNGCPGQKGFMDDRRMEGPMSGPMRGPMGGGMDKEEMMQVGMMVRYLNLETVMETQKIAAAKIFLDAKEKKIGLNQKRRDLDKKLMELSSKYKDDNKVGTDVIKTVKELRTVTEQIDSINKDAMDKIKVLNESRKKEVSTAVDNWVKKIETDKGELEKYIQFLNDRPMRPMKDKQDR